MEVENRLFIHSNTTTAAFCRNWFLELGVEVGDELSKTRTLSDTRGGRHYL